MVKKILLIIVGIILILIIGLFIFINTGPQLPPETDAIIDYVLQSELPEFIKGKTGIAKSGEIEIWYESLSPMGTPIASV